MIGNFDFLVRKKIW